MKIKTFLTLLFLTLGMTTYAQKKTLTLEELFSSGKNYAAAAMERKSLTLWGNQCVERNQDQCDVIDAKTGKHTPLFNKAQLAEWLHTDKNKVNCKWVTFPYASKTIAKVMVGNDVCLLDWKKGELMGKTTLNEKAENTDWNAASQSTAYTVNHNLFVLTKDNKTLAVTTDGSRSLVYGESVHRNEFGIMKGTFWNNDGSLLAFYKMDQSMVTDYPQVDISNRCATYEPDKYPMAGMTSHKVEIGVYNPNTQKTVWLKMGDVTDRYFSNISWNPDNRTIYVIEINRDQNHAQLVSYNALTGDKIEVLYEEKHPKYVEPEHGITFLPWNKDCFIYQTRRDGYNHLYLFNLKKHQNGEWKQTSCGSSFKENYQVKQLTQGAWEVINFYGFTSDKAALVQGNGDCPIDYLLYKVNFQNGKRSVVGASTGVHNAMLSSDGSYLIDNYSSPSIPRNIDLVNLKTGKATRLLTASNPWADYNAPIVSGGSLKAADGTTDLYYRMVKPADFDPNKKYPTVVYVYGGPHVHNVDNSWNLSMRPWEAYMAGKGYILFVLDNRGSNNRGLEFENVTFRHLGREEMKDQMKGVEYLRSLPYVDKERMGVHGWSFGGFMTTNLMVSYPDAFKVAVAGGPVIDWKYYEVMYGERYMDKPQDNPEGYNEGNLCLKAKNLKGRLQIILGYNDPTCVPQHTLSFMRACIDAGTQPDLFLYPGDGHGMMGRDAIHLHDRITRYFEDYLK